MIALFFADCSPLRDETTYHRLFSSLPEFRQKTANAYLKQEDRVRSVGAYLLLKKAMQELGYFDPLPDFAYGPNGKPFLPGLPYSFNISHSGERVVVAVSDSEVGVDVERVKQPNFNIASRFFTPFEESYVFSAIDPKQAFFDIWVMKESYIKRVGKGLGLSLTSFSIGQDERGFHLADSPDVRFTLFKGRGYVCASCSKEIPTSIKEIPLV